jgi:hypothetical protein
VAGPDETQSLIDYGQADDGGVGTWGPVNDDIGVSVDGVEETMEKLSSPDPFTATYQMPNGDIVVSNLPLEDLLDPDYDEGPTLQTAWTAPDESVVPIAQHQILVWFKDTASAEDIQDFIDEHNLQVIFSWFEPGATSGNVNAWFQFQYDPEDYATFDDIYTAFGEDELVAAVSPNIISDFSNQYSDEDRGWSPGEADEFWPGWTVGAVHWYGDSACDAYGMLTNPYVELGPESAHPMGTETDAKMSDQVTAVVDDGVWRPHEDFTTGLSVDSAPNNSLGIQNKISWIGVNVFDHSYVVGNKSTQCGEPIENPHNSNYVDSHGTQVAGTITAGTFNKTSSMDSYGVGTSSLAPDICVLPLRLKHDSATGFNTAAVIKAIRSLRFEFNHGAWLEKVRVINMSLGGIGKYSLWPVDSMKSEIQADLNLNDRLYVAAAGNDGSDELFYPAAFSNCLGVSGLRAYYTGSSWAFTVAPGSNYDLDAYKVSGIFEFYNTGGLTWRFQFLPVPDGSEWDPYDYEPHSSSSGYEFFSGTSFATPQVSALAALLYDAKAQASESTTYDDVRSRIIDTAGDTVTGGSPERSVSGLISFYDALSGWGINEE